MLSGPRLGHGQQHPPARRLLVLGTEFPARPLVGGGEHLNGFLGAVRVQQRDGDRGVAVEKFPEHLGIALHVGARHFELLQGFGVGFAPDQGADEGAPRLGHGARGGPCADPLVDVDDHADQFLRVGVAALFAQNLGQLRRRVGSGAVVAADLLQGLEQGLAGDHLGFDEASLAPQVGGQHALVRRQPRDRLILDAATLDDADGLAQRLFRPALLALGFVVAVIEQRRFEGQFFGVEISLPPTRGEFGDQRPAPVVNAADALEVTAPGVELEEFPVRCRRRAVLDGAFHDADGVQGKAVGGFQGGQVEKQLLTLFGIQAALLHQAHRLAQVLQCLGRPPHLARRQPPLHVETDKNLGFVAGRRLGVGGGLLFLGLRRIGQLLLVENRGDVVDGARRRHERAVLEGGGDLLGLLQ